MSVQVTAREYTYTIVEDLITRFEVIFTGLVLDELSGDPLNVSFSVEVDREDLFCKTVADGLFCVAADVGVAFPDLTVAGPPIQLTVRAEGYRDRRVTINFPANPTFPMSIATLALPRIAVRLQGRVSENTVTHPPIPDARIMTAGASNQLALMRAPVRLDHPIGTTIQPRTLNAVGLPAKKLAAPLASGQLTVLINNRQGLAFGQILRIGSPQLGQFSRVQIVSPNPANLALPGEVTLDVAPNRSFAGETPIEVFILGTVGVARQLVRAAGAGDGLLSLNGTLTADTVEIVDPPNPTEYHAIGAFTDADGYYSCDGIGGVAALDLNASAIGFATPAMPVSRILNYNLPTNVVDFRL